MTNNIHIHFEDFGTSEGARKAVLKRRSHSGGNTNVSNTNTNTNKSNNVSNPAKPTKPTSNSNTSNKPEIKEKKKLAAKTRPIGTKKLINHYVKTIVHKSLKEPNKNEGMYKYSRDQNLTDNITMDIPLFIRLLEWAKEDAKDDVALHKLTEQLIAKAKNGTLTMEDYKELFE